MTLLLEAYHECAKPTMITGFKNVKKKRFLRNPLVERKPTYFDRFAKWTCDGCKARWEWHPCRLTLTGEDRDTTPGWWQCTYRPETWEEGVIDEGKVLSRAVGR